jgi:hypothetical protein
MGRLSVESQGFAAELLPTRKSSGAWHQFTLAHEIAHTLFYDIGTWPPRQLVYLEPGNRDLEWFCYYIAKCLMIPVDWLRSQINRSLQPSSEHFSLSVLLDLARMFSVPWQIAAERLVEDLGAWNCIMLRFTARREINNCPEDKKGQVAWHLDWQTIPEKGTQGLFIPIGRRRKGGKVRFPRAQGAIVQFIEECVQSARHTQFLRRTVISSKTLSCRAVGSLHKFLRTLWNVDEFPVHVWAKVLPENLDLDESSTNQPTGVIVMCFPLQQQ